MEYIFDKSMLTELANNGCQRQVINRLDREVKKKLKINGEEDNEEYISSRLGKVPFRDTPPLATIKKEGELAEILKIEELSYNNAIVTEENTDLNNPSYDDDYQGQDKTVYKYHEFVDKKNGLICFCPGNSYLIKKRIDNESISSNNFKMNLFDDNNFLKEKFTKIFSPNVCKYVYQPEFKVNSNFFLPFIKSNLIKTKIESVLKQNIISFKNLRPDLVKILPKDVACTVLNQKFEIVPSSNKKIKLQICDIKMSEFTNKFFIELGLYMTALTSFIYDQQLDDDYEVCATGIIYPQDATLSNVEREENMREGIFSEWICSYSSVKSKFIDLFNIRILETLSIIENAEAEKYNCVQVNHKCQTCDYYGGQFSDHLKAELKKILNKREVSNDDVEKYYWMNSYCRYTLQNENSINLLSCLKDNEKKLLIENRINTIPQLDSEIKSTVSNLFSENKNLKADKPIINKCIEMKSDSNLAFNPICDSTLDFPGYSNLQLFIDERHDTQGRSLSFSFAYNFNGNIEDIGDEEIQGQVSRSVPENTFRNPYIAIIQEYSPIIEKRFFLDYLIKINSVLEYYENATDNYGKPASFAILYWNKESIKHFEKLFINILNLVISVESDEYYNLLTEMYPELSIKAIKEKERDIKKVRERFNSFFTTQDQLVDYRVVEKNPFFSLKDVLEQLFVFDINYNNTLIQVYNLFCNPEKIKKEIYYKPDSDHFSGTLFSEVWSEWNDRADKENFIHRTLKSLLRDRLYAMSGIVFKLRKVKDEAGILLKGIAPEIPLPSKPNLYPNLRFGRDLMLMHKLDSAYSLIEKEKIHNEDVYRKSVLGKAIAIEREITGEEKSKVINMYFGNQLNKNYRVYQLSADSVDARFDDGAFDLTIYPSNKREYIYKKFVPKNWKNVIQYDEGKDLLNIGYINGIMYKEKVKITIEKLDRIELKIIISVSNAVLEIMDFLEKSEGFNFGENLIIEAVHTDYWGKKLDDALKRVAKKPIAVEILEDCKQKKLNNHSLENIDDILNQYCKDQIPLDSSQKDAIVNTLNQKISMLWGPPGTGKSHTIAYLLLSIYLLANDKQKRVLILGNYDATDNIINSFLQIVNFSDVSIIRIKSRVRPNGNFIEKDNIKVLEIPVIKSSNEFKKAKYQITQLNSKLQIFTCTPSQLKEVFVSKSRSFMFDLVIVDEASQMDVGHFIPALIKIGDSTQFLLAGDHLQLPPITSVKLKGSLYNYWGSVFDYYNKEFVPNNPDIRRELKYNRRSNKAIVEFSKIAFGYPEDYKANDTNAYSTIKFDESLSDNNFYESALDPTKAIVLLSYKDGISQQSNAFEAREIVSFVKKIWDKKLVDKSGTPYGIRSFFDKGIGIVVPHRTQRTKVQALLIKSFLQNNEYAFTEAELDGLQEKILSSVDTVEKYQGQERDIMLCGYVVGDSDFIAQEEEFIFNPNRLNVMVSRAKNKAIILASKEILSYTSNDLDVLTAQQTLQDLVEYCNKESDILNQEWKEKAGSFKYKLLE